MDAGTAEGARLHLLQELPGIYGKVIITRIKLYMLGLEDKTQMIG